MKNLAKNDLLKLSKSELADYILKFEKTFHKVNLVPHSSSNEAGSKNNREFDIDKYCQRKIALKVAYLGWNFDGLASQPDSYNTIEHHLFAALKRTRLISDRSSCDYNRSGRTDKGVSALCQVVSLKVRSNLPQDHPDAIVPIDKSKLISSKISLDNWNDSEHELQYCNMINKSLPDEIKILGWASTAKDFSARFDCRSRHYKYFFCRRNLDIEKMQEACKLLEGDHDFRNFCKLDNSKGHQSFVRSINQVFIARAETAEALEKSEHETFVFNIKGSAFLWHQVRCIMGVLFLIGEGLETPDVISKMLDIEKIPERPHYVMAPETPLVLWNCTYEPEVSFHTNLISHKKVIENFKRNLNIQSSKSSILKELLGPICDETVIECQDSNESYFQPWERLKSNHKIGAPSKKKYVSILNKIPRNQSSLQERMEKGEAKLERRLKRKSEVLP